jgi:mannose-1-phosphate guanylyltransferase
MNEMPIRKNAHGLPLRCGIVLAGGEGKRLRSFVQRVCGTTLPKQYVTFIGTRSMLEHTFHRAEKLIHPERIFTVVNADHWARCEVRHQLANRPRHTVVVQPENKETAPGLLLPLIHICKRYPQATVAVFPSDHFIVEEDRFMTHVYLAIRLVEKDPSRCVFLGVEPNSPESDYGYILPGREILDSFSLGVRAVSSFIEKPTSNLAQDVIKKGGLWNTMVMIFNSGTLLKKIRQMATTLYDSFRYIEGVIGKPDYAQVVNDVYRQMEPMNFSKGFLETLSREISSDLTVLPLRGVHWSDWGSEQRIISTLARMEDEQRPNRLAMGAH